MTHPRIIIHCALLAEAKVLLTELGLSKISSSGPVQLFSSQDERVLLLVSGVGIINTSIACAWISGERDCSKAVWLNTGIAGHASIDTGQLCWASSVAGALNDKKYYPYMIPGIEKIVDHCSPVATSLMPITDYTNTNAVIDMEAWAVFNLAVRLTTIENIHSFKIISDNMNSSITSIDREYVMSIYSHNIRRLKEIVSFFTLYTDDQETKNFMSAVSSLQHLIQSVTHTTVSQRHQIDTLLRRALALRIDPDFIVATFTNKKTKDAIDSIHKLVIKKAFS